MQLGTTRLGLKDTAGARRYQEKALKICEETNNRQDLAQVFINMSLIDLPDYKKAIATMLRVNTILDETNPSSAASLENNTNLADAWHHLAAQSKMPEKEIYQKKAASCLSRAKALADQNRAPEMLANILLMQADLEQEKGNYKTALAYYKKATVTNDSLFSQEKKNEIAGL
jgi:tetratricopeptide (TPR) repeat protein